MRDVLHFLLALIHEVNGELSADRFAHRIRYCDPTWLGQCLQASSDVHTIAVRGAVGGLDHVSKMHSDAKLQVPIFMRRLL